MCPKKEVFPDWNEKGELVKEELGWSSGQSSNYSQNSDYIAYETQLIVKIEYKETRKKFDLQLEPGFQRKSGN